MNIPLNDLHIDITAIIGLIAMGIIGTLAVQAGGAEGMTVAAGVAGAIGGWLAKGSGKATTTTEGDPAVQTTLEG